MQCQLLFDLFLKQFLIYTLISPGYVERPCLRIESTAFEIGYVQFSSSTSGTESNPIGTRR